MKERNPRQKREDEVNIDQRKYRHPTPRQIRRRRNRNMGKEGKDCSRVRVSHLLYLISVSAWFVMDTCTRYIGMVMSASVSVVCRLTMIQGEGRMVLVRGGDREGMDTRRSSEV
ncbi:hypothetical protein FOPE_06572 [Fonsecaea pedrosoi]|nr:hypothetical protein FOPE_06572 [Fonsecaea pedrosoi]